MFMKIYLKNRNNSNEKTIRNGSPREKNEIYIHLDCQGQVVEFKTMIVYDAPLPSLQKGALFFSSRLQNGRVLRVFFSLQKGAFCVG